MAEAEALLIGLRQWKIKPDQMTRDRLQSVLKLEAYWERLSARQHVHNLEDASGLDALDYAEAGE
jgi:hypothetical protein